MGADVWYFAYGSNLWIDQMAQRTGAIRQGEDGPRMARLAGFRLAFNKKSKRCKFAANIMCPGDEVVGVVYRCDEDAMRKLDAFEPGYKRETIRVVLDGGETVDAVTYVAKAPGDEGKPTEEYLEKIVTGATQHRLPDEYVEKIEKLAEQ